MSHLGIEGVHVNHTAHVIDWDSTTVIDHA